MKIVLLSSTPALVNGGHRNIVNWLAPELERAGHRVETIWLPFVDEAEHILPQTVAYRLLRLEDTCDAVITFRPPAHLVQHPRKVVWFIHHIRPFYDLWGTAYCPVPATPRTRALRAQIHSTDTLALREAHAVFSNSRRVAERLLHFNGIASEVLYPPLARDERALAPEWGDDLVMVCRMEPHKRQHLAVEAMRHVRTPVRLRLCGQAGSPSYLATLQEAVARHGLHGRVMVQHGWLDEDAKHRLLETALAAVYLGVDEDSYGYPTLEAARACKATVVAEDGGGVREFVVDDESGIIAAADPIALAGCFDRLWSDRREARRLGEAARARIDDMQISWERVTEALITAARGRETVAGP